MGRKQNEENVVNWYNDTGDWGLGYVWQWGIAYQEGEREDDAVVYI